MKSHLPCYLPPVKRAAVLTQGRWPELPYFSLSSDLHTSLCISSTVLQHNMTSYWLPNSVVLVWLLLKSNITASGYCGEIACCSRRFGVLNDPGVAWLMEGFRQYFSNFWAEHEWKAWSCHLLRAPCSRSAEPGREPTETTGLLVEFLSHPGPLTHTFTPKHRRACTYINTRTTTYMEKYTPAHLFTHTFTLGTTPALQGPLRLL